MPRLRLVVLQPTPFCNISCRYCYLPNRASKARMSLETVDRIFAAIFETGWAGANLDVVWHAGEPLVLPVAYYRAAFDAVARHAPDSVAVRQCFQTNGMLIDDAWCEFFKSAHANVGISIDGPEEIHNANRVTRMGRGTFAETLAGIRCLQKNGVPFYVISVITDASLARARDMFAFYDAEGIRNVCFNVDEIEGSNQLSTLAAPEKEIAFGEFLRAFWNHVQASKEPYFVREVNEMIRRIVTPAEVVIPNDLVEPFSILNFDCEGNFTTFSPELLGQTDTRYGNFVLGNVWTGALHEAAESPVFKGLSSDVAAGVEQCRATCEYFAICGGGAPSNKLYENGRFDSTETLYCRLRTKAVAKLALEIVENSASSAEAAPEAEGTVDLYLLGAGVSFPQHLTTETLDILRRCAHVYTNLPETLVSALPSDIARRCTSLWPLYQDKRVRSHNYRDTVEAVLAGAARERPVAWLTPGHPVVFDSVTTALADAGRRGGLRVCIIPAVSCFDTLLADLGYDPAQGLFVHEATALVARKLPLMPSVATLLLQPGVFGSNLAHVTPYEGLDLDPLREHLQQFYPPEHRCAFVRSSSGEGDREQAVWVQLRHLTTAPYDSIVGSTLFVPALAAGSALDR